MKTNRLTITVSIMLCSLTAWAQTSFDAAKLYEEELNGTARYVGMGGAMSALGSDISVINKNPAGIGTYTKSDINLSLSLFGTSVQTDPLADRSNPITVGGYEYYSHNSKSDLITAFDNFSIVFSGSELGDNYFNLAFSYRKLQNMDRNLDYIDSFSDADGYEVWREYKDHQRNKVNSFDINLSYNISDKLYLGWTLGLLSTNTWSEGYFYDYYDKNMHPEYPDGLDWTTVDKMNQADGSGWNMGVGLIVRPIPALRLGAALRTPTLFRQRLTYSDYLYSLAGVSKLDPETDEAVKFSNSVEYKFSSPWMINLSGGLTFGKTAVGAEYERHFTQRSSLSIGNTKMNNQAACDYKDYSVFKVGVEQNINYLSLRAGYNYIQPMFKDGAFPNLTDSEFNAGKPDEVGRTDFQIDRLGTTQNFTAGFGFCGEPTDDGSQLYLDIAYVHGVRGSVVNVNEYDEDVDVKYNYKTNRVLFTVGWVF